MIKQYLQEKGQKHLFTLISIQLVFLTGMAIALIVENGEQSQEDIYKWVVLFMFTASQFYYAWHAILKANVLELFAYLMISTCTTIASCLRFYRQIHDNFPLEVLSYCYIGYALLVQLIGYAACRSFYKAFIYDIYVQVGASVMAQRRYKWYTYFQCLMAIYAQLTIVIFMTFYMFLDWKASMEYFLIDALGIMMSIAAFILGYFGVIPRLFQTKLARTNMVFYYFVLIGIVAIYEVTKLVLYILSINFDYNQVEKDWATQTIIFTIFGSSLIVLVFNIYYGMRCISIKLEHVQVHGDSFLG